MSTIGSAADALVDDFVGYLNQAGFQPKYPKEVPEELRTSATNYEMFQWQIRASASNLWVEKLAQHLPEKFPRPFRSLIDRYRFCNFEIGPVMFFANTGHDLLYELSARLSKPLPMLHEHGYLQFGNPHETNFDPICFDMQRRKRDDAPIVQLDHEEILIRSRVKVVAEIAPSFMEFMQRAILEKFSVQ